VRASTRRLTERLLTRPAFWAFLMGLALGVFLASGGHDHESKAPQTAEAAAEPTIEEIEASLR